MTLQELINDLSLSPDCPDWSPNWETFAEHQLNSPVETLCYVQDGINRSQIYIVRETDGYEGIVLANYSAGSQMHESREAWLDALGEYDRDAVIAESPEVANGTCFEIPEIEEASEEIATMGKGDKKLTLYRVTGANKRGWAIGLEWIETNGDPITENEEGFRDLRDQITGDDDPSDLLRDGVEISLERLENVAPITLRIIEAGNGLPSVGALVYDSASDTVYRTLSDIGQIQTGGPGGGNWCLMTAEEAGDASDYTDEEWENEISDCRVEIAE